MSRETDHAVNGESAPKIGVRTTTTVCGRHIQLRTFVTIEATLPSGSVTQVVGATADEAWETLTDAMNHWFDSVDDL